MQIPEIVLHVIDHGGEEKNELEAMLRQAGYHLACTNRSISTLSEEALDSIDLILVDFEAWKIDKSLSSMGDGLYKMNPAVVAIASLNNINHALKELHQSIDHIILRPFTREELLKQIKLVLSSKRRRWLQVQSDLLSAVNRLTASIAHEINNPLQSVQNCIHMIQFGKLSDQAMQNYILMVSKEVARLTKEVKRMLDYYQPRNLEHRQVETNELVTQALGVWRTHLQEAQIDLRTNYTNGLPPILVVDSQIRQALSNLIENAIEAMPNGGQLTIKTGLVDKQVIIDIVDNGPGVLDSLGFKVFEPFTSSKENRVGLGLTISYGIIAAHNGFLELIRHGKGGAHFRISLPTG
jgi:two-component system NtrC family sensor kinase